MEANISSPQSPRSTGVSKEFLSNLWLVPENLAEKTIEINNLLRRQSKDNPLSRNHAKNDRTLR